MRINYYWSKLAGSQYGYLDWGIIWLAANINIVWNYSLVLKIVVGSVGTGLSRRRNNGFCVTMRRRACIMHFMTCSVL